MMTPCNSEQLQALIQHAAGPGISFAVWPYQFDAFRYTLGHIILPQVTGAEVYVARLAGCPDGQFWLVAIYVWRGDPDEPTKARYLARQFAREVRTCQYAWFYKRWVTTHGGRHYLRSSPKQWLRDATQAAGAIVGEWFTTST